MKNFYLPQKATALLFSLAAVAMFACTNDATPTPPPTVDPGNEQIAAEPFKSIKATVGEETVTATVQDEERTISLTFDYAESFKSVKLVVELNDGWSITNPADPDNADLSDNAPSIVFQKKSDNSTLEYRFQMKTYAFPIADPTKITVEGATINGDAQNPYLYTIHFEVNSPTSVEMRFAEGALMEGATIDGLQDGILRLEFGSLTSRQIDVLANNKIHTYTFRLDMPAAVDEFLQKLLGMGNFIDKTAEYAFASKYDYIKVYNATELKNMPGATKGKGEDGNSTSEPVHWTNNSSLEVQEAAMRCLGDCKESDFTETVSGVNFTVVTVDKSKVSGRIEASSEDRGFMIDGSEGLITMSGNVVVREDQKFRNNLIAVNGTTVANHLSWAQTFRTAIAFDNAGAIHFVLAGLDKQNNSIRQLPFCEDKTDHNIVLSDQERDKYYYGTKYANYFLSSWAFNMKSVATAHMLVILNGESKGWRWGLLNDGWMNVALEGSGRSTEYVPMIYINGENVSGGTGNTCPLCYKIVYDPK